jgi:hypothetical protein
MVEEIQLSQKRKRQGQRSIAASSTEAVDAAELDDDDAQGFDRVDWSQFDPEETESSSSSSSSSTSSGQKKKKK